jgi:serine/threonine-protein kinase RsbT
MRVVDWRVQEGQLNVFRTTLEDKGTGFTSRPQSVSEWPAIQNGGPREGRPRDLISMRFLREVRVAITADQDIVTARQRGERIAREVGFRSPDPTLIATAISELARNIVRYATRGEVILRVIENEKTLGLEVVAVDKGPGIRDISLAMVDGYSTSGSLGLGLAGVCRLMDDFEIKSAPGKGTNVTARKWRR